MLREILSGNMEERSRKGSRIFPNGSCIIVRVAGAAANAESTSLTNLVFPVRRRDQPLDKSVFIRKEGDPSLFINLAPTITRSLFSRWLHSYPRASAIRFPLLL